MKLQTLLSPELSDAALARLVAAGMCSFALGAAEPEGEAGPPSSEARRFILEAAERAEPGAAVVVGAAQAGLPLAELAARFSRLTLSDLSESAVEALIRRDIPEPLRERICVERYDLTGSFTAFEAEASRLVADAASPDAAEAALVELSQGYDVGLGSAGLCSAEGLADFAVSLGLLSGLGAGFDRLSASCFAERGWPRPEPAGALAAALTVLSCRVQQQHVGALLRRSKLSVLISAVSEVSLPPLPGGHAEPSAEPRELLYVERLAERLPSEAELFAEATWEEQGTVSQSPVRWLMEAVAFRKMSTKGWQRTV